MCGWIFQEGNCIARVQRANGWARICGEALDRVRELEASRNSADLFTPSASDEEIALWWGIHAAAGQEFRRLRRLFDRRCNHTFKYQPLEGC